MVLSYSLRAFVFCFPRLLLPPSSFSVHVSFARHIPALPNHTVLTRSRWNKTNRADRYTIATTEPHPLPLSYLTALFFSFPLQMITDCQISLLSVCPRLSSYNLECDIIATLLVAPYPTTPFLIRTLFKNGSMIYPLLDGSLATVILLLATPIIDPV